MTDLVVTAMGPDRPGIIAALAEVLHGHDANIADATMTALSGHVAIVLQVSSPRSPADLEAALEAAVAGLGLSIGVGPATIVGPPPPATHLLSVYGADQPGLLAAVTRALADGGATVVDLTSQLLDDEGPPTYAMSIELVAPDDDGGLEAALAAACDRLGVDHQLRLIMPEHD